MPLPIGYGQTISQPSTVRLMLDWLDVKSGDKVLDLGSGSGWTAALLSMLAGSEGKVYAVERIPELLRFGEANCSRVGVRNISFHLAPTSGYGLKEFAPYDRILVSASAHDIPEELLGQLASGGKMVIPVENSVMEVFRDATGSYTYHDHPGFVFVPLV